MKKKETSTSPEPGPAGSADGAAFIPQSRQEPGDTTPTDKSTKAAKESKNCVLTKVGRAAMKRHNLKEVYVTSDGQSFARKSNALAHARNLKDSEVITVK